MKKAALGAAFFHEILIDGLVTHPVRRVRLKL